MGIRNDQMVAPEGYRSFDPEVIYLQNRGGIFALNNTDPSAGVCYRCGTHCNTRFEFIGFWYGSTCILRATGHELDYWVLRGNKLDVEATELREDRKAFEKDFELSCEAEVRSIEQEEALQLNQKIDASKHFPGLEGERYNFIATVTDSFSFATPNSPYGSHGYCTKLRMEDGVVLIYWNSISITENEADALGNFSAQKGYRIRFKAAIKKHGFERDGVRATIISRVTKAVVESVGSDANQ